MHKTNFSETPNKIKFDKRIGSTDHGRNVFDGWNGSWILVLSDYMMKFSKYLKESIEDPGIIQRFSSMGNVGFAHHFKHIMFNINFV